jgi:hypothetical protein
MSDFAEIQNGRQFFVARRRVGLQWQAQSPVLPIFDYEQRPPLYLFRMMPDLQS